MDIKTYGVFAVFAGLLEDEIPFDNFGLLLNEHCLFFDKFL